MSLARSRSRRIRHTPLITTVALLIALLQAVPGGGSARAATGQVTEINVGGSPYGITAGPHGVMWFTDYVQNQVGKISRGGVVTRFDVPTSNSAPSSIATGADGNMWFAELNGNRIGRVTPDGEITEYPVPAPTAGLYGGVTLGPDGNIWFVEENVDKVAKITPAGVITEYPVGEVLDITAGPDGNLWGINQFSTSLLRMSVTGASSSFPAVSGATGGAVTSGADGNIWFTYIVGGQSRVGKMTTSGTLVDTYALPAPADGALAMTSGPDGNVWLAEWNPGRIAKVSTAGVITEYPVSNGGLQGIAVGGDGNIWFTSRWGGFVGRLELPSSRVPPGNDDFAAAVSLNAQSSPIEATNLWASKQAGEPAHGSDAGGASVWYSWTPGFTGTAVVSTSGSDFDTLLGVYTGASVAALSTVASNDDAAVAGSTSRVCFPVTSGTTYHIAIDGWSAAGDYDNGEGAVSLAWEPYAGSNPCPGLPPVISGLLVTGAPVFASTGVWAGTVAGFDYQWFACNPADPFGCFALAGATADSYLPPPEAEGYTLFVRVTARHPSDPSLGATSVSATTAPLTQPPTSGGGPPGGGVVSGSADLYLTGSVEPASAPVGGTLTWRLRVLDDKNYAPASGVYVDVTLPAGAQVGSTSSDRGPGCKSTGTGMLRCSLDWLSSDAPYGNIVIVTNVPQAGEIVLQATVGYAQTDPVPSNNALTLRANTPVATPTTPRTPATALKPTKGVVKSGTGAANALTGTPYNDTIRGLGGNDRIDGKQGADRLFGGPGDDLIIAGSGIDLVEGGSGKDRLNVRDGQRDTVRCGAGRDVVAADRLDKVSSDCESVVRR